MSCNSGQSIIIILTLLSLLRLAGNVAGMLPDVDLAYRRNFVRKMMKSAWNSYRSHAWGEYAVFPLTNEPAFDAGRPGAFRVGATILASLDTLFIMDLKEEFKLGETWIKTSLNFTTLDGWIQIDTAFEEYAASLLSAYFLTNNRDFVLKAQEIAELFLPNFISPSGLPFRLRNPAKDQTNPKDAATYLSELGTFRLEFLALSNLTGRKEFKLKADYVTNFLKNNFPPDGLFRDTIDVITGQPYEGRDIVYGESQVHLTLVNDWLLHGNTQAREMFDRMQRSFIEHGILKLDSKSGLLYLTDMRAKLRASSMYVHYCMSGGVNALAAMSTRSTAAVVWSYDLLSIAKNLTRTCHQVSKAMSTGLAPAKFSFGGGKENIFAEQKWNKLYPYIAYSYFVLYRLTGDPVYREWGWEMVQSIELHAKAAALNSSEDGYAGLLNVASNPPIRGGMQEPHFLGGTLKFLYLLFSDTSYYDLRDWIFNARGHLMPVAGPSRLKTMKEIKSMKTDELTPEPIAMYMWIACATIACGIALLLLRALRLQRRERTAIADCGRTICMHSTITVENNDPIDFDSNYAPVFTGVTGLF